MNKPYIAVLMGGFNLEREVSLASGEAVYQSLIKLGYKAIKIDFNRNIAQELQKIKPDIVFNALHGKYGEDGRIQGLLDILKIPYTHSNSTSCALCMDKVLTRKICSTSGIKIPKFRILNKNNPQNNQSAIDEIGKPFVIKPIDEGSSVGIEIILKNTSFDIEKYDWKYGDKILIEEYISGQEVEVAVLKNKALGAIEIRPKELFYNYKCKYTSGMTDYIMPAEISSSKYQEVLKLAVKCHEVTGCSFISRVDFILNNENNQFYLLEVNTHPGLTENSLVPKIADYQGIKFDEIVEYLIKSAKYSS